jgi:DNA-binding XRE family transcriptional regulator
MKFASNRKEFTPFDFTITLETKKEAEFLYRLFNLSQKVIQSDNSGILSDNEKTIHLEIYQNYARVFRPDLPRKPLLAEEDLIDHKKVLPDTSVGKIIRGLRIRDGITQQKLADNLGICVATMRKIEHDQLKPADFYVKRLAAIFNIGENVFKVDNN